VETDKNNKQSDSDCSSDEQFDQDDDSSSSDDDAGFSSFSQVHEIDLLMTKCRTIVNIIRKSSILYETAQHLARDSSLNAGLIIDMRVRWNSSFKMLQRLLLYQTVLDKLYEQLDSITGITDKQRNKLNAAKITGTEWHVIQALRRVLERFDEATKVLSGRNYPTLSLGYAVIMSLSHYLNNQGGDSVENEIKSMLLDSFEQYMMRDDKEMTLIQVSALLDPLTHDLLTPEHKQAAETYIINEVIFDFFSMTVKLLSETTFVRGNEADLAENFSVDEQFYFISSISEENIAFVNGDYREKKKKKEDKCRHNQKLIDHTIPTSERKAN
jgi:hypothetical protein